MLLCHRGLVSTNTLGRQVTPRLIQVLVPRVARSARVGFVYLYHWNCTSSLALSFGGIYLCVSMLPGSA